MGIDRGLYKECFALELVIQEGQLSVYDPSSETPEKL